jgi:hypothetical protein
VSIASYSDLVSAVPDWMQRPGDTTITTIVPDLIRLAEDMFNYGYGDEGDGLYMPPLRTRDMETRAVQTVTTEYATVPTDFLELRSIKVNDNPEAALIYSSPQQFAEAASSYTSGSPRTYTIVDGTFRFGPSPAGSEIELFYYAAIPALTADAATNWLLAKAPSAYLYGALFHAAQYIKDDPSAAKWFGLCAAIVRSLQRQDRRAKYGAASLIMRPVTPTP